MADNVLDAVCGPADPELDGFTMEEFMNMTRTFVENAVSKQYPAVDVDRLMELVVDAYVTRPQITDPEELRAAFVQVGGLGGGGDRGWGLLCIRYLCYHVYFRRYFYH